MVTGGVGAGFQAQYAGPGALQSFEGGGVAEDGGDAGMRRLPTPCALLEAALVHRYGRRLHGKLYPAHRQKTFGDLPHKVARALLRWIAVGVPRPRAVQHRRTAQK